MFQSENNANGINNILHDVHKYVPYSGDGKDREYSRQPIVGDQLTVECAVNGHIKHVQWVHTRVTARRPSFRNCSLACWKQSSKCK